MSKANLLMLAIVALLFVGNSSAASEEDRAAVAVMSFNIRYGTAADGENQWKNRKQLVFDVIGEHSPDVIGLQEALRGQLDDLRKALPEYSEIGEGRDGDQEGEYSAILYRTDRFEVDRDDSGTFWLSETPEQPSRHWGNACIRVCTWARLIDKKSGHAFYMYNTHLDHQSQSSREKGIRLIVARIQERKHQDPFVLTGDFNAGEKNPVVTYLEGTGTGKDRSPICFRDSFRVVHPDEKVVGTFNGFGGRTSGEKIDYVFVPQDTRVLNAAIIRTEKEGRYPSDHFPVVARLRFEGGFKTKGAK